MKLFELIPGKGKNTWFKNITKISTNSEPIFFNEPTACFVGNLPGCLLSFCRQAIPLVDSLVNIDQQRSFKANTDINVRLISKNCI